MAGWCCGWNCCAAPGLRELPVQVAGARGGTDGQMIPTLLLLNIVGDIRVSDVEVLEADRTLCRLVRDYEEAILGVSAPALAHRFRGGRDRTFPSSRSVLDWLARFQDAEAAQAREPPLHQALGRMSRSLTCDTS